MTYARWQSSDVPTYDMRIQLANLRLLLKEALKRPTAQDTLIADWLQRHDDIVTSFDTWNHPQGGYDMSYDELSQLDLNELSYVLSVKLSHLGLEKSRSERRGEPTDEFDFYIEGLNKASIDLRDVREQYSQSIDW